MIRRAELSFWRWLSRLSYRQRNRLEPGPWVETFGADDGRVRVESPTHVLTVEPT
jgi:hypothetical protein